MPGRKTKMTDEHKQALAEGRELGKAVRDYLEALEQNKPKRGRKRTPDSVKKRLATIESALPDASPIKKVELIQERSDLTVELATMGTKVDLSGLEKGFVKSAKTYSERKGITYSTWREVGVPADVLKRAGITRAAVRSAAELVADVGRTEHRAVGDAHGVELGAELAATVEQERRRDDRAAELGDRGQRLEQRAAARRGVLDDEHALDRARGRRRSVRRRRGPSPPCGPRSSACR